MTRLPSSEALQRDETPRLRLTGVSSRGATAWWPRTHPRWGHGLAGSRLPASQKLGRSARQVRIAVHALEARGLVVVTREYQGWRGEGEYGTLVERDDRYSETVPAGMVVKAGERYPRPHRWGYYPQVDIATWTAKQDIEFIHNGVPTCGLYVWLPANRRR